VQQLPQQAQQQPHLLLLLQKAYHPLLVPWLLQRA
jgi:hypothetical protein